MNDNQDKKRVRRQQLKKVWGSLGLVLLGMLCLSLPVFGEEGDGVGFTVSPVFPDNQVDKRLTYFDLQVKPDEPQQVKVKVKSLQKEPLKIKPQLANAWTNRYGKVDYGVTSNEIDDSLKDPLTEIAAIDEAFKEINLKAFEEKEMTFTVTPPKEAFDGIKLGAISFVDITKGTENGYGYRIGIILTEKTTPFDENEHGELVMNSLFAGLDLGFPAIHIDLQNPEPYLIQDVDFHVEIRKSGKDKVLVDYDIDKGSVAPNSQFNMRIPWDIKLLGTGIYDVEVIATSKDNKWRFRDQLEIRKGDVKQASKAQVRTGEPQYTIIIIVLVIVICINVAFTYAYRKHYFTKKKKKKVTK